MVRKIFTIPLTPVSLVMTLQVAEGLGVSVIDAAADILPPRLHPRLGWPHDPLQDLVLVRATGVEAQGVHSSHFIGS